MKNFLKIVLYLVLVMPAYGAITADTSTATTGTGNNATSVTVSHTVGGGCSNSVLIVGVAFQEGGPGTVSTVVWDPTGSNQSATFIAGQSADAQLRVEMWYRKSPTSGTHNLVVTPDGEKNSITVSAITYCGVDQTTPIGTPVTGTNSDATITINVTSATGELVVDAVMTGGAGDPITVGAGQTQRSNFAQDATNHTQGTSSEAGASPNVTMSWGLAATQFWGSVGVSLKPAAASSSSVPMISHRRRNQ